MCPYFLGTSLQNYLTERFVGTEASEKPSQHRDYLSARKPHLSTPDKFCGAETMADSDRGHYFFGQWLLRNELPMLVVAPEATRSNLTVALVKEWRTATKPMNFTALSPRTASEIYGDLFRVSFLLAINRSIGFCCAIGFKVNFWAWRSRLRIFHCFVSFWGNCLKFRYVYYFKFTYE